MRSTIVNYSGFNSKQCINSYTASTSISLSMSFGSRVQGFLKGPLRLLALSCPVPPEACGAIPEQARGSFASHKMV